MAIILSVVLVVLVVLMVLPTKEVDLNINLNEGEDMVEFDCSTIALVIDGDAGVATYGNIIIPLEYLTMVNGDIVVDGDAIACNAHVSVRECITNVCTEIENEIIHQSCVHPRMFRILVAIAIAINTYMMFISSKENYSYLTLASEICGCLRNIQPFYIAKVIIDMHREMMIRC